MLTLPSNFVRYYRDDITVTVVYFDENYLKGNLKVTWMVVGYMDRDYFIGMAALDFEIILTFCHD